jgi:hypothetical protein
MAETRRDTADDTSAGRGDTSALKDRFKGLRGHALARAKEDVVIQLRQSGITFERIAELVGYQDRSSAHKAFQRSVRTREIEASDEVRWLELGRLEEYHRVLWPRMMRGDIKAGEFLLKVHDRRAKLLGLDAPTRLELTRTEDLQAEYERLCREEDDERRRLSEA